MMKSMGTIKGKGDGNWGRVTINRNGSILLENVTLSDIKITNCELHAESGEYPSGQLCRFVRTQVASPFAASDSRQRDRRSVTSQQAMKCFLCHPIANQRKFADFRQPLVDDAIAAVSVTDSSCRILEIPVALRKSNVTCR
jgi:hypothetical protein